MKVYQTISALVYLLCSSIIVQAQNPTKSSLRIESKNEKTDSVNLIIRARLALENAKIDFNAAQKELEEIKKISLEKKLPINYLYAARLNGAIYYEKGDYLNAIIYYSEVENVILGLPNSKRKSHELGSLYNDLGASYSLLNDLDNAQKYYNRSIELAEKNRDSSRLVLTYFNLAFVFIDMQEWEKAIQYLLKSIDYVGKIKLDILAFDSYARAAAIFFKLGKQEEGKKLLANCERLMPVVKLDLDKIYYHNAYGEYHYAIDDMNAALAHHQSAYKYSLSWKDPYYIADEALDIGRIFRKLNKADSAESYFRISFDTAKAYNYMPKIRFILNEWSVYYANEGNYKRAYGLRTELLNFTDSLVALQNHNHILLFDARYQRIRRENQIKQLESDKKLQQFSIRQKNTLNYILIATAFIILIISLLSYRIYRNRQRLQQQRINELEIEKQLTATEAVLKGEEQERTRLAKDLHDGLGGMLSGIKYSFQTMKGNLVMTPANVQAFERSMDMLDSSIKEMRRVAHNMMPEALVKFGLDTALKDFCNDISQSGALLVNYQSIGLEKIVIEQTTAIAIYRIVQELINNTMKHAAAKTAIVQVSKINADISITVEDDGKGFNPLILQGAKGMGWSNIQSRVEYLKGILDVQSEPGKGTSVHIELNT